MNKLNFYIVGSNIRTSLSPKIHNALFQIKNKPNFHYALFQENILPSLEDLSADERFGGISITIPFKKAYHQNLLNPLFEQQVPEDIILGKVMLKYVGQFAKKSKVADNQLQGYNTDVYGIQKVLNQCKIGRNVFLTGAGATAQTFCHYFSEKIECQKVFLWNRTKDKIKKLHQKYHKVTSIEAYSGEEVSTIINTLPTLVLQQNYARLYQTLKDIHACNAQYRKLAEFSGEVNVMDVNYRDQQKVLQNLVKHAFSLGNKPKSLAAYSGLDMLIWQAIAQNELFCQKGLREKIDPQLEQGYFYQMKKYIQQK